MCQNYDKTTKIIDGQRLKCITRMEIQLKNTKKSTNKWFVKYMQIKNKTKQNKTKTKNKTHTHTHTHKNNIYMLE